jgi:hypothetical protein
MKLNNKPNKKIINKILSRPEFLENPPILLDIGASGEIYQPWKDIAKYSICVAFDADAREIKYIEDGSSGYKKIYIYNKIVTALNNSEENFYLTKSPFCSSLLEPDMASLADWSFYDLFKVEKVTKFKTINLNQVLAGLKIKKIDWFKTDSQGTDLRLFTSLNSDMINRILVVDFEPGIIDAYIGEDKLGKLLSHMDTLPFWVEEMKLPKTVRIKNATKKVLTEKFGDQVNDKLNLILKSSPFCAEISFLNNFKATENFSKRDYLLMWVISYIRKQYAFALEIALTGEEKFNDEIFDELKNIILKEIRQNIKTLKIKKIYFNFIKLFKKI